MTDESEKFDSGKVKWSLLPYAELEDLARVQEYGADKYGVDDWKKGFRYGRWWNSIQRHLVAFKCGEDIDESGHHHLALAAMGTLHLLYHAKRKSGTDDR